MTTDTPNGIDCNRCEYLNPNENEQTKNKEQHVCNLKQMVIKHGADHPRLNPPESCPFNFLWRELAAMTKEYEEATKSHNTTINELAASRADVETLRQNQCLNYAESACPNVDELMKQVERLKEKLELNKIRFRELEVTITSLKSVVGEYLKPMMISAESAVAFCHHYAGEDAIECFRVSMKLACEVIRLKSDVERLTTALKATREEVAKAFDKELELVDKLAEKHNDYCNMKEQVERLTGELSEAEVWRQRFDDSMMSHENTIELVKRMNNKLVESQAEVDRLHDEIVALGKDKQDLTTALTAERGEVERLTGELERSRAELANYIGSVEEMSIGVGLPKMFTVWKDGKEYACEPDKAQSFYKAIANKWRKDQSALMDWHEKLHDDSIRYHILTAAVTQLCDAVDELMRSINGYYYSERYENDVEQKSAACRELLK